jgi:hypothetical protein
MKGTFNREQKKIGSVNVNEQMKGGVGETWEDRKGDVIGRNVTRDKTDCRWISIVCVMDAPDGEWVRINKWGERSMMRKGERSGVVRQKRIGANTNVK